MIIVVVPVSIQAHFFKVFNFCNLELSVIIFLLIVDIKSMSKQKHTKRMLANNVRSLQVSDYYK